MPGIGLYARPVCLRTGKGERQRDYSCLLHRLPARRKPVRSLSEARSGRPALLLPVYTPSGRGNRNARAARLLYAAASGAARRVRGYRNRYCTVPLDAARSSSENAAEDHAAVRHALRAQPVIPGRYGAAGDGIPEFPILTDSLLPWRILEGPDRTCPATFRRSS